MTENNEQIAPEDVRVSLNGITLTAADRKRLKILSFVDDKAIGDIVEAAIVKYLDQRNVTFTVEPEA
jgi:hypothetical protein